MGAPSPVRLGWVRIVELALGLLFVAAGVVKLSGMGFMVELFSSLGFGQWLRYATAVVELTGGVLLLAGRLEYLAAPRTFEKQKRFRVLPKRAVSGRRCCGL